MTDSTTNPVRSYLDQLQRLTADLPFADRTELLVSIEEHLNDAGSRGELTTAFATLGAPEEVARAARTDLLPATPKASRPWIIWATLVPLVATIAGFTLLGAILSITARFDEDADWNVHPLVVLFAVAAGAIVGILVSIVIIASRHWRPSDKIALIALWIGAAALAFAGSEVAASTPAGTGFVIAPAQLLFGGVLALAAIALSLRAARRNE